MVFKISSHQFEQLSYLSLAIRVANFIESEMSLPKLVPESICTRLQQIAEVGKAIGFESELDVVLACIFSFCHAEAWDNGTLLEYVRNPEVTVEDKRCSLGRILDEKGFLQFGRLEWDD